MKWVTLFVNGIKILCQDKLIYWIYHFSLAVCSELKNKFNHISIKNLLLNYNCHFMIGNAEVITE